MAIDRVFQDSGHRLTGYIERTAAGNGHFFDPRQDKVYQTTRRAFGDKRVLLTDSNAGFDRLLVKTEGPGDPETWWLINIATGHADPLGYSYDLAPGNVGPMTMVPFTAADGLKMEGVLTLPPVTLAPGRPAKGLPAVILPHGGPAAYDDIRFDWIAQAFAWRGYAVFQPNFRGSTGYGVAFQQAGDGEWGRKMQTDISDGLAELVRQGVVDPRRVCIVGASYGGYAALAGVTLQHGIYRCAVAIAGIGDLGRMIADDTTASNSDRMLIRNLKREIGSGRDLQAISPVRFADKADAPILLIHGKDDTVVNFNQSTLMADALRRAGKPVEFVTLLAEDHWLSKGETRLQMLQASVEFVTRHNPPDAPASNLPVPATSAHP
ncbi:prolyl oligopeptidase family serine peptidase [Novosphingobium sp.]|uniref:alpha/beta hydrolase family protein n=1 Tax=Novosphingobium sp. TaxID=1874826 RepID=UPI003340C554